MAKTVISARFIKSTDGTDSALYDGKPQVAFIGRSNTGKSSLINSILSRDLARSSSNPGKTRLLDIFLVNNQMYFVDLPGYGFANVSKKMQEHFSKLIDWYLFRSGIFHALVVLVVDAKAGITAFDRAIIDSLREFGISFVIAANKIDKLKQGERTKALGEIRTHAGESRVVAYSAVTAEGQGALREMIFRSPQQVK